MTKIIFRKDKPNFEKYKSMHNFDALLEQHRKKAKKRLRLSIVLLLIEVLVVLLLVCVAVYKLNSLQQGKVIEDKIEKSINETNIYCERTVLPKNTISYLWLKKVNP